MDTERPAAGRTLPRSIGRYRILDRLGKGSMGVVYSAHDSLMERTVAIKVMMTDLEDDPETSARFYREARSAGRLVHPNIITIFDMGEDEGRPFIVMELLEGETLNKYMQRPEAADLEHKIDLMMQICDGLHAAHTNGIFHRDIKPGNLLVRSSGELKIVDFGIARLASSNMTASGLTIGTPDYMSPEQARGEEVDQRSDIFSAGAVFYLMLTGRKPFAASNLAAVLAKVQSDDPLPIRDTEAPPSLARVVMKALAKNPADRYHTCAEMLEELEHLKGELDIETRQWADECSRRLETLQLLAKEYRALVTTLEIDPPPGDIDARRAELLRKRASLSDRHHRSAVADLLAEIRNAQQFVGDAVERWQRALSAIEDGSKAAAAGRLQEAVACLDSALLIEPAAKRAATEADRWRATIANQRAIDDRATALLEEARNAAAAKQWQAAVVLCNDALLLDSRVDEAKEVKRQAVEAIETDARERRRECERALARADAHYRKKRFQDAAIEIVHARSFDCNVAEVDAAEERLKASMAQAARESLSERQVEEAIAVARSTFSGGERDRAVAELRTFYGAVPEPAIAQEIDRLQQEAERLAAAERRAVEAEEMSTAAEAALAAGDPQRALELATNALAADPRYVPARKVSGLAAAAVKQQAQAQARASEAARHVEEAKEQVKRGKFDKARAYLSAAADLNPANSQYKLMLAQIHEQQARVEAETERGRVAKQRAKAVAPILERARAAESNGDYERAAWTAENALAVDPDCLEAKEILRRARAHLKADPSLSEDTRPLAPGTNGTGDPDDTVRIYLPGLWERILDLFTRWRNRRGVVSAQERRTADSQRMKT